MKTLNITILGILFLIGAAMPAQGAVLTGKDYPYYIFEDEGVIRYCEDPEGSTTPCWSNGVATECDVLKPVDGYINCKDNESSN